MTSLGKWGYLLSSDEESRFMRTDSFQLFKLYVENIRNE